MVKTKPYIIFIEGQDRVGKTSIIKPLFEVRGKIDNVYDRGPLSNYVYSKMYKRKVDLLNYLIDFYNNNYIIIYLDLDIKEIEHRTVITKDYDVPLDKIKEHKKEFDEAYEKFKNFNEYNIFKINCNNKTIKEIVDEIKEILDNL